MFSTLVLLRGPQKPSFIWFLLADHLLNKARALPAVIILPHLFNITANGCACHSDLTEGGYGASLDAPDE